MKKLILFFLTIAFLSVLSTSSASAKELSAGSSAVLITTSNTASEDYRTKILRKYLEQFDSPLAPYAGSFVENADKYDLDWKFVAAISGLESTFGKQIPYGTYNGWGWGIYGTNRIYFKSWEDGIGTVSQGLRTKYMDTWGARDVYSIGKIYAASPTWAQRVTYFMNQIEAFKLRNPADSLS
ncbi:MAG: hypothetical protein WD992_02635, partial [Candidatus Levyibacteriota bacterium]